MALSVKRPFRVFDSELDEEYPKHGMYAVAYEPIWQSIREGCRLQWDTYERARLCCARLQMYINRAHKGNDRSIKIWRVLNYVNTLPYGRTTQDGIHVLDAAATDFILAYVDSVRNLYRTEPYMYEWDWAISRNNLLTMWRKRPDWSLYLLTVVSRRASRFGRVKPELRHYIEMSLSVRNIVEEEAI